MLNTIALKNAWVVITIQEKAKQLLAHIRDFKETHTTFFMKCATIYMAIKIVIILLATFSTLAFLLSTVVQHLAIEMSKSKAILLASPLTLVVMLKLYFIFKILMTYERSRLVIQSVIGVILLKSRQGMQRIEETLPDGLSSLSLGKARNR